MQHVLRVAAGVDRLPDAGDRVERRELVRPRIHEVDAHQFARLGLQHLAGRLVVHRVVAERDAVEDDMAPLVGHHLRHVLRVGVLLGLHQHVLAIGLRHRAVLRLDQDGAVHAARHVLDHRVGTTVIEEHPRVLRHEGVLADRAGADRLEVSQYVFLRRMHVDRVRVVVGLVVDQGDVDGVAFGDPYQRPGNLPVERPRGGHRALVVDGQAHLFGGQGDVDRLGLQAAAGNQGEGEGVAEMLQFHGVAFCCIAG